MTIDRTNESVSSALDPTSALIRLTSIFFPKKTNNRHRSLRLINIGAGNEVSDADIASAIAALTEPCAANYVDGEVIARLIHEIDQRTFDEISPDVLRDAIVFYTENNWERLRDGLIERCIQHDEGSKLFRVFPALIDDPMLVDLLTNALRDDATYYMSLDSLLEGVSPSNIQQARLLIEAIEGRSDNDRRKATLTTSVYAAIGRGLHWSPWAVLQAILRARPDYADPHARFEKSGDRTRESLTTIAARLELASNVESKTQVRDVAGVMLELVGSNAAWNRNGLLERPAEVRAAYVDALRTSIADDHALRQAVIEALLWFADGRSADLAQFAAVALAHPIDRDMLIELESHPVRIVRFSARAVRAAKFGERIEISGLPYSGSLIHSLSLLDSNAPSTDEPARTWLGDRSVERLIEQTIAREEARFAREYLDHGDEGEDRLLSSLFAALAIRFGDLDQALEALARATSAAHRASISMRYRNIDRAEEGRAGVNGVRSFSADLCLIVNPTINGISMGRRVTLVQAKRHYQKRPKAVAPTWETSFRINTEQLDDLLAQTNSSVYFFHGPEIGGRGIPVIPAQLVADLSRHEGSGSTLTRAMVGAASRSLSDWLTYDALALRVGDHYQALVTRAEGRSGALPRALLDLPGVEVDVSVSPRSSDRER